MRISTGITLSIALWSHIAIAQPVKSAVYDSDNSVEYANLLAEIMESTPHTQHAIARKIAAYGPEGQTLLQAFLLTRPDFLTHALNFVEANAPGTGGMIQELLQRPRAQWGEDLYTFAAKMSPDALLSLIEAESMGFQEPFHNDQIFVYAGQNGTTALQKGLHSELSRETALRLIAASERSELLPSVVEVLSTPDNVQEQISALSTLSHFPQSALALESLDRALQCENPIVVNAVLEIIAKQSIKTNTTTLMALISKGGIKTSRVIRALGVTLDISAMQFLQATYSEGSTEEKFAVVEAVSKSRRKDAIRLLMTASMERNTEVGRKARALLAGTPRD